MITQDEVWENVWPTVERFIEATLAEDEATMRKLLLPKGQAPR